MTKNYGLYKLNGTSGYYMVVLTETLSCRIGDVSVTARSYKIEPGHMDILINNYHNELLV